MTMGQLARLFKDESGATAVEYGLIIALIVIAIVGSAQAVADVTSNMWDNVSNTVQTSS